MSREREQIHCSAKRLAATHGASFKAEGQLGKHVPSILTVSQTMNIGLLCSIRSNERLPLVAFQNHQSQDF